MNLYETAMYWKKMGMPTIPIRYRDKRPDSDLLPEDASGHRSWEVYQRQLPTEEEIKRWFPSQIHNIGLVLGWQGLAVIDFDDLATFARWLLWTTRAGGMAALIAQRTYQVKTARGMHVYIRLPFPENNRHLDKIDIKARGGYVLIPPSVHPTGTVYQATNPGAPILMVGALSDVLPADMLVSNTEYTEDVSIPHAAPQVHGDDPWASAERVPDPGRDLVDQIREAFRVEGFFPNAIKTSGNGRWLMANCPFHDDHHPSFWIDVNRQICGCHAGCTPRPLDSINLYARLHGIGNRDAIFYMMHSL